jgi:hypothetical protein
LNVRHPIAEDRLKRMHIRVLHLNDFLEITFAGEILRAGLLVRPRLALLRSCAGFIRLG